MTHRPFCAIIGHIMLATAIAAAGPALANPRVPHHKIAPLKTAQTLQASSSRSANAAGATIRERRKQKGNASFLRRANNAGSSLRLSGSSATGMNTSAARDAVKRLNRNTSPLNPDIRLAEKVGVIVRPNHRWVIGRTKHLEALDPHQRAVASLLPNRKDARLNWQQNYGTLRYVMSEKEPIADVSIGRPSGVFLSAERYVLLTHGWRLDKKAGVWMPPSTSAK